MPKGRCLKECNQMSLAKKTTYLSSCIYGEESVSGIAIKTSIWKIREDVITFVP